MAAVGKRSAVAAAIADSLDGHKRKRQQESTTPEKQTPGLPRKLPTINKHTPDKKTIVVKPTPEKVPMANNQELKVCGPEYIQTLRGHLLGREVAIILCGEAHNSALDLTRPQGIIEAKREWIEVPRSEAPGYHPEDAFKTVSGLSLEKAKAWAHHEMDWEFDETHDNGFVLLYEPAEGSTTSVAHCFDIMKRPRKEHVIPANAVMYHWFDTDADMRHEIKRQVVGDDFREKHHDSAMAKRKQQRKGEGLELFDDWLVRRYKETTSEKDNAIRVDFVHEGQVPASELELHVEPGVPKTPPAHECLKVIEFDSDHEEEDDVRPDDGCLTYSDYLTRRVAQNLAPVNIHGIDPRNMAQTPLKTHVAGWRSIAKPLQKDLEEEELKKMGAIHPKWYTDQGWKIEPSRTRSRLPSWEVFFGQAAEFLYYSGSVRADYVPFLATCLPTSERLLSFFDELYFGTVPQAITHLGQLDDGARSLTRIRSIAHSGPNRELCRRPTDGGLTPVKAAPIDRYLKARGSHPPRTWVSGLAGTLCAAGGEQLVKDVKTWYWKSVMKILDDPKGDSSGDYFAAFLRETHPEIYSEIDPGDPSVLRQSNYVRSLDIPNRKKRGHYIGNIKVPSLDEALAEVRQFKSEDMVATSKRQRVLAKIILDVMQLRLVDVAAILKVATIAASAPAGSRLAVVFYGGADHTSSMITYFRGQGFSHKGLTKEGLVDGRSRKFGESCGLKLPAYLHDFELLFPVP